MNSKDFQEALKELMDRYDHFRSLWINKFGTDKGFDEWFTRKVDEDIRK